MKTSDKEEWLNWAFIKLILTAQYSRVFLNSDYWVRIVDDKDGFWSLYDHAAPGTDHPIIIEIAANRKVKVLNDTHIILKDVNDEDVFLTVYTREEIKE